MRPSRWNWLVVLLFGLVVASPAQAQGGIAGKVTNKLTNQPIGSAPVEVIGSSGQLAGRAVTSTDGRYRVTGLAAGTYSVSVIAIGYKAVRAVNVVVAGTGVTTVDVGLEGQVYQLEAVTTAVSKAPEKAVDAPAQVSVVAEVEITERPALSVIDHVKGLPGVDISQGGLVQSNVVGRGFNNIFSGALLTLIDNRFAAVPSLRVNVPGFFTATDQDIEQMTFVLGPGAALYGPNSANGVLAITTKSPFDSKGTTLSFEAGYRADSRYPNCSAAWYGQDAATCGQSYDNGTGLYRAGLRHAGTVGTKFGYKISGEYLKGTEWNYRDPAEPTPLPNAAALGATCNTTTGCRDFNLEKYNFDVRMDVRPGTNTEIIGAFGYNNAARLIEYTGIGAGQARNWAYSFAQLRVRHNKLFAQVFGNFSNSGNSSASDRSGTYLLRDGNPIVDNSKVWAAQIQHGVDIGSKESLLYGIDYAYTDARTDGTVNGRNENNDNITEIGGYIHSVTRLSNRFDLTAAVRVDKHSALQDPNVSPRAALVYRLAEDQNIRFTYNRAFSTPSNNNLFLDLVAGSIPGTPFKIRALGVPQDGFNFRGYCGAGGVDNLCMWSEWPGAPDQATPVQAAPYWAVAREAVLARLGAALPPQLAGLAPVIAQVLRGVPNPTPAQVGTALRTLDPTQGIFNATDPTAVTDISALKPTISNVLELGYKGIINGKFRFDADVWHDKRNDFVGPLIVESPNVFLDLLTTGSYLGATFAPALVQALTPIVGAQQAIAIAQSLTPTIAGGMAGLPGSKTAPGVPLGTVVPNSPLTQGSDMFLTYRNFGDVELWGADLSFDYLVTDRWSFGGMYSWVNKDYFSKEVTKGPTDIALNAPANKAAAYGRFRQGATGFMAEARVRYVAGFPINSGVYVTPLTADGSRESINDYTLVDTQIGYQFKWGMMATLNVQNLLNRNYQTFVGLPQLGRLVMTRLTYTF
jgi:outer membrane receptor for ferrienterochelin and colicins